MKKSIYQIIIISLVLLFSSLACQALLPTQQTDTPEPTNTPTPSLTSTPLPTSPVQFTEENPNEPVAVSGSIPYTSPFFLDTVSESFVLLEDQAGFVERNLDFKFALTGQAMGPVMINEDDQLTYNLSLPAVPQGTLVDVDNNGSDDSGVQIFAVAYWSNTWGGPFLEERDGTGWSSAYASTKTDADLDYEIVGGTLIVWAPDGEQAFPTGFGPDELLFTDDDPTELITAGYNIVNLDSEPFEVYKLAQPVLELIEGSIEVTDYSNLSYEEAFDAMFEKASREYPFTDDKNISWESLYRTHSPKIADASNDQEFFIALHDFTLDIPDGHVGISFTELVSEIFFNRYGGSFGMILTELDDGRIIVEDIIAGLPADDEGIQIGAEILEWNGEPVQTVLDETDSFFGPYSTEHHKRLEDLVFLTRVPPNSRVEITYLNPNAEAVTSVIRAEVEYDSLFMAIPSFSIDELELPVFGEVLDDSGIGYIRISTFSDDYNLMAQLWDRYLKDMIDLEIPGLIIDIRVNGGGSSSLASNFSGYFYESEQEISRRSYYNNLTGGWEIKEPITTIEPAPVNYDGDIAVLVSPYCISACEGFAYSLAQLDQVILVGHYPTSGAYGEVGRGQYDLPAELSMQFPTGRSETPAGELLIEGTGVAPDILVPVTYEGVLSGSDVLLQTAIEFLIDEIE